ncbi:hypothetical protein C8R43DRAFT_1129293 [Mycena crocata]|nr:hypothetical protein C8R43DRAFT_1129293 [Mycena crocata]
MSLRGGRKSRIVVEGDARAEWTWGEKAEVWRCRALDANKAKPFLLLSLTPTPPHTIFSPPAPLPQNRSRPARHPLPASQDYPILDTDPNRPLALPIALFGAKCAFRLRNHRDKPKGRVSLDFKFLLTHLLGGIVFVSPRSDTVRRIQLSPSMKSIRKPAKGKNAQASTSLLASIVPTYKVTFHTDAVQFTSEERYAVDSTMPPSTTCTFNDALETSAVGPTLPFSDAELPAEDAAAAVPAYEKTVPCDAEGVSKKTRQTVAHMEELKSQESVFLEALLSLHHSSQLLTPCVCGTSTRRVGCNDCLQPELLCPQCWLKKHRATPTHWAMIWNDRDKFFEKHDFCRVMKNAVFALGHHGERCPEADLAHSFTLVDTNGIHATAISFCRCKRPGHPRRLPEFQQLLRAGVFPGSVKEPKTGYTLGLLDYYRQLRSQGKGSAYNFILVLQRMADPFFGDLVPDVYINFLAITRFHQYLDILLRRGFAHGADEPIPGEVGRPYPNRPIGFRGILCGACPERGVNMPLTVNVPDYLRHLISMFNTIDGNYKANLFFKRDDGSDVALTDGNMYFPKQSEYEALAKSYVIPKEDKEVPCKAHIGSIRHQGSPKYGNTAVSGVVACACEHAVAGSFVDMLNGEAFALGSMALREHFRRRNSPPHMGDETTPIVTSYDSWCSFCIYLVERAKELYPEEEWLHELLAKVEGQIPADHINGHGINCQMVWQAVYAACRAHFHGETAEYWGCQNDIINFVMDAWNTLKVLRQAELLADERVNALQLFELHMTVLEDLSRQHATEVPVWSRLSRTCKTSSGGVIESVYQHQTTKVLTIDSVLASLVTEEREKVAARDDEAAPRTLVARWIRDGMELQREQALVVKLLENHRGHPKEETWATITKLRGSLNTTLKKFREEQRAVYPRLTLSALDAEEPELTAIQLPSYRMKHGQRASTDTSLEDVRLRNAEIKLRCSEASNGILAVQKMSLALSAVNKARDLDYRGQAGNSRSGRNVEKAMMMKTYEIEMYNHARAALIHLGYMEQNAVEPYPPLTYRDTRRKETHLHRATGDSRLFDGMAWYLQSGVTVSHAPAFSALSPVKKRREDEEEPALLAGTQSLKRSGISHSPRKPKRLKEMVPEDVVVESSASEAEESDEEIAPSKKGKLTRRKAKKSKRDGWIWMDGLANKAQSLGSVELAKYKEESDRVQWFRAEAEMYRWLEAYERKHAELWRVIARFERDRIVWAGRADREQSVKGSVDGAVTFARMQAAMYKRLKHNAEVTFKNPDSGAHSDWVSSTSFDELVMKVDQWRDVVFKWMDQMGIHRAYKDF